MTDTPLILHVKGSEAETMEMSGQAVREAVAQGKLSESQLIWRPAENAWKAVKDIPELLPEASATSSEAEPAAVQDHPAVNVEVPSVAAAPVQLRINTAAAAVAPPVRLGSGGAAPPPTRAGSAPASNGTSQGHVATNPDAAVAPPKRAVGGSPTATAQVRSKTGAVRVATASAPIPQATGPKKKAFTPVLVQTTGEFDVPHKEGIHFFKGLCIALLLFILGMIGGNYYLIDKPLTSGLAETRYARVPVYGHLGAFVQPNVVVIHLSDPSTVRRERVTLFLVALAKSTPRNPLNHELFGRVALTNAWTAQYSFSGYSWDQLAGMGKDSEDQRKEFIMDSVGDDTGQSLIPATSLNDTAQKAKREKVWQTFVEHFSSQ